MSNSFKLRRPLHSIPLLYFNPTILFSIPLFYFFKSHYYNFNHTNIFSIPLISFNPTIIFQSPSLCYPTPHSSCIDPSEYSFCKKSEVELRKNKEMYWHLKPVCHACLPSPPFPALSLVGAIHIGAGITVMIWFHPSRCGACKSSRRGLILWHWHGSHPECKVWPVRLLEDGLKGGLYALEYLGHVLVIVSIVFGVNHPPHVCVQELVCFKYVKTFKLLVERKWWNEGKKIPVAQEMSVSWAFFCLLCCHIRVL